MDASVGNDAAPGPARTAEVLWGPSQVPRRGPKPKLSRERIVATAVGIADVEGLGALSMQRVADELGCAKMALYRHVPGKTELTALMLDSIIGMPPPQGAQADDWRHRLRTWATSLFTILSRHPWMLEISVGVRVLGPNELTWLESGLRALAHTGLSGAERLDAIVLILGHVRALAQQGAQPPGSGAALENDLTTVMSRILAEQDDYPQVRECFGSAARVAEQDNALDFGLDRIVDGLAVLIDGSAGPARQGADRVPR